jgi:O-antigen/teichoic acid export membrane protein
VALSLLRAPRYLPYWAGFLLYNYRAMLGHLLRPSPGGLSLGGNAAWLAAARVAPMVTGFLFWALAAFLLPPSQLGLGSAVVSAALLTVQLGMLGVGPATLTLLPAQTDGGRRLIATSLLTVALSALLVAAALAAVTHAMGPGVGTAWTDPAVTIAFLAAALFATVAYQLDHVGVAQARADRTMVRSVVQGTVQLAVLLVCLGIGYHDIAAIVGAVAAGALASVVLGMRQLDRSGTRPDWKNGVHPRHALSLMRPGLPNHALVLADRAPGYILPLIVAAALTPSATAAWYIVWMLASAVFFVPQSAGYALQTKLATHGLGGAPVGSALRISLALTLVAGAILLLAGPVLLQLLGPGYAPSWVLLPILVPALIVSCVTQVYYGVCRARGRLAEATAVAVLAAVIVLAPAVAVAQNYALTGVSALWLVAQLVAALVATWRLAALTREAATPPSQVPSPEQGHPNGIEVP